MSQRLKAFHFSLTLYLIETHVNTFANRADPDQDQAAHGLPDQGLFCLLLEIQMYDLSDPTLVDLTSNFSVLCTNMKVCLPVYKYS